MINQEQIAAYREMAKNASENSMEAQIRANLEATCDKFRNVDSPTGETIRSTPVNGVEFPGEKDDGSGIYGVDSKGRRIFVHHDSILEVRWNYKEVQNDRT